MHLVHADVGSLRLPSPALPGLPGLSLLGVANLQRVSRQLLLVLARLARPFAFSPVLLAVGL